MPKNIWISDQKGKWTQLKEHSNFQLCHLPLCMMLCNHTLFSLQKTLGFWFFKTAQPLCFRIYRPQALHWQEQCFTLATSMAEFSTAAVDPFDSDDLRLEALKRAWKGAKTRLANWQLGKFQTFIAERVLKKNHWSAWVLLWLFRDSFQWKRYLRQRWDLDSASVVINWQSWRRITAWTNE